MEKQTNEINFKAKKRTILKRAAVAYLALLGLPGAILLFSFTYGAGWKPVLSGMPVILTILASITYQLVKEIRALGREERGEPEPPPKKGPWEEE